MARIEKRVWPEYFQAIQDGKKNFELRLGDWECKAGDSLVLKEWDPKAKEFTGRVLEKEITYVARFKIDELFWSEEEIKKHGIQVISLK